MTKHTPGPWDTNPKQHSIEKRIAIVRAGHPDEDALAWVDADDVPEERAQANVALITAAPEMADALEALKVFLVICMCGAPNDCDRCKALRARRAALTKAGRKP